MLGIVNQASLHLYERNLERLVKFWPGCWHLIITADEKCRCEHLERTRRKVSNDLARGFAQPHDWDAANPWTCCFRLCASDEKFWNEQVRHPAASWTVSGARGIPMAPEEEIFRLLPAPPTSATGTRPASTNLEKTARNAAKRAKTKLAKADYSRLRSQSFSGGGKGGNAGGGKPSLSFSGNVGKGSGKGHQTDQTGMAICFSWNNKKGSCAEIVPGGVCPNGRVHKCSKCLSPAHIAATCPA